ncbi:response regulator transcription factor [Colwellia sp. BRX8-9]|uniref:response regulator n=1 Tax=Colwellia sp. BRX8-9 TaxID=2759831 RepID=UPI0015F70BDC|nr:response regulator transcription factor [Colwellia sp. BRX8-9]MBA6347551.1 response regulator transcription factor [Colwellia sp. BRX8-9]
MFQSEKIIIADDHPLFRQALTLMISAHFSDIDVLEAEDVHDLERSLAEHQDVGLLLLDLNIPGAQGFNTLITMRERYPQMAVVVVSGYEEKDIITKAIDHGAVGFIPKSTDVPQMLAALEIILAGGLWTPNLEENKNNLPISEIGKKIASLTNQQNRILKMFSDGLLNKQIASQLSLSEATVKSHASSIFLKLGVKSRTQAVIMLNQNNHQSFSASLE